VLQLVKPTCVLTATKTGHTTSQVIITTQKTAAASVCSERKEMLKQSDSRILPQARHLGMTLLVGEVPHC